MPWIPSHKIYASNGTSLIYTIEDVVRRNPALSVDVPDFVEHENLRSAGSIIIPGGNQSYNISLYARLTGTDYSDLMTNLQTLQSTIAVNIHYYLKIDTSDSTTDDIKVMRQSEIVVDPSRGNLNKFLYFTVTFRADSWR